MVQMFLPVAFSYKADPCKHVLQWMECRNYHHICYRFLKSFVEVLGMELHGFMQYKRINIQTSRLHLESPWLLI